jgi:hypothetical protein
MLAGSRAADNAPAELLASGPRSFSGAVLDADTAVWLRER